MNDDDETDYTIFNHCRIVFPNAPKQAVTGLDGRQMNSWFNYNETFRDEANEGNLEKLQ